MGRKKKRKKQRAAKDQSVAAPAATSPVDASLAAPSPAEPVAAEAPPAAAVAVERTAVVLEPTPEAPEPAPATPEPVAAPVQPAGAEPPQPSEPPALDLDVDASLDDDEGDYHSLVALVAGMEDEEPDAGPRKGKKSAAAAMGDEEEIAVVDLDAEIASEPIARLIAKAVVGAPPEEVEDEEPEAPVIDLDADEPPAAKARPQGSTPTAGIEAARLAMAAARGGIDEPDVPTFYLEEGGTSTPEMRARLLAEALAHAEHKEARYRVPTDAGTVRRWKLAAASIVLLVAGWVAVVPPGWVRPEPPAQLSAPARVRALRTALFLQSQQVDAFRVASERLPTSLAELPASLPGIGYARSGNRAYQLIGYAADGSTIIYDSADPAPPFLALRSTWMTVEARP